MRPTSRRTLRTASITAVAVTLSVAVVGVSASSPSPTDYASTVVSYGQLPHNGWSTASGCVSGSPSFSYDEGPATPPEGRGSLVVSTPGGGGLARVELPVFGVSALTLSTITARYDTVAGADIAPGVPGAGYASLLVTVQDPAHPDAWTYVSVKGGAAGQGWQSLDLLTSGVTVDVIDKLTGAVVVPTTSTTWGQLRAFTSGATVIGATLATACWAQSTVAWDAVTISLAGLTTTYDFEPSVPSTLSAATASPTAVVSGVPTTVSGALLRSSDFSGVVGTEVELWGKPYGAADFTRVTTVTSGAGGVLGATVRPTKATTYRWALPAASSYTAAGPSGTVTVVTKPALTLNRIASGVTYPAPVVLYGAARPVKAGTVVTLRRSGTSTAVATTTVKADGTFAFARKLARGTYTFWVTVPATTGQSVATSAKVSVKVS